MRSLTTVCIALSLLVASCSGDESREPVVMPADTDSSVPVDEAGLDDSGASGLADAAKSGLEAVSEGASDYVSQAETLLAEVQEFLAANNVDKAKLSLAKLEGLEASLPADWGEKIATVRSTLAALEAKGVKLPGLGGVKLPGSDG